LNGYVEGFLIFEDSSKNKIVGGFRKETDQIVIPDTVEIIGNGAQNVKCFSAVERHKN